MQNDLLIVAGFGWHEGIVNQVVSQANESSPQGRAYITGKPVICKDLAKDNGFVLPDFYAEHGIVSTIDVIVKGLEGHRSVSWRSIAPSHAHTTSTMLTS